MNYQDSNNSKNFFKDHWHRPLGRVRKILLPILVSMIAIFLGIGLILAITQYYYDISMVTPMIQATSAVFLGVAITVLGYVLRFHHTSQFQLIRVKIKPQERSYD